MKCIKMLTFLPMDTIQDMELWDDSRINEKKEILAFELTQLVHGTQEANKAKEAAYALFSGGGDSENMPTTEITADDLFENSINITNLIVKCGICTSKGEAKRLIQQGGISINDEIISALDKTYTCEDLKQGLKIRKGKKHFHKAIML